jgi:hypothetical protein
MIAGPLQIAQWKSINALPAPQRILGQLMIALGVLHLLMIDLCDLQLITEPLLVFCLLMLDRLGCLL